LVAQETEHGRCTGLNKRTIKETRRAAA